MKTFAEYTQKRIEESVAIYSLAGMTSLITFLTIVNESDQKGQMKARINKIIAKLRSLGVKKEFDELKSDRKLIRAIRFGSGGDERAMAIVLRHLESRPQEESQKLLKAFEILKTEVRATQTLE